MRYCYLITTQDSEKSSAPPTPWSALHLVSWAGLCGDGHYLVSHGGPRERRSCFTHSCICRGEVLLKPREECSFRGWHAWTGMRMYAQMASLKFQIPLKATYSKEILRDMHRKHKYKSILYIKKNKNLKLFSKIEEDNQRRRKRRPKRQKRNTNDF